MSGGYGTAQQPPTRERLQSPGEEIANSISHGVGFLLALLGAPILVLSAVHRQSAAAVVGASIFAATTAILYLTSTLYHALPPNRVKQVFQILDHAAIFLLIAGTYTPFTLGVLWGGWGWSLLGVVWGLALLGVVLKAVGGVSYVILSTLLYVGMGWLGLIAFRPLWLNLPPWGLVWLFSGGLAYTVGVGFFVVDGLRRYAHFVWHLFVIAGTSCHFVAVFLYAARPISG